MPYEEEIRRLPADYAVRSTVAVEPQAFQGFDSPSPLACLLSRVPLIVPCLLITDPQSEEMVDEHENFVGDG